MRRWCATLRCPSRMRGRLPRNGRRLGSSRTRFTNTVLCIGVPSATYTTTPLRGSSALARYLVGMSIPASNMFTLLASEEETYECKHQKAMRTATSWNRSSPTGANSLRIWRVVVLAVQQPLQPTIPARAAKTIWWDKVREFILYLKLFRVGVVCGARAKLWNMDEGTTVCVRIPAHDDVRAHPLGGWHTVVLQYHVARWVAHDQ